MSILLTRVDNRLVHGQILEAWAPHTNTNSIVIFNDDVFNNSFHKEIIQAFVPSYIEVIIKKMEDIPAFVEYLNSSNVRCIILFFNIHDAFRARNMGLQFSKLNLGNIHCCPGRKMVTQSIYLDDDDIRELKTLKEMGIQVEIKTVPNDKGTFF